MTRRFARTGAVLALAGALAAFAVAIPQAAWAETDLDGLQTQADDLVASIEQTTAAYRAAVEEVDDLDARITQNEERVAQIEEELPAQRARTAASIKSLYLFHQSNMSPLAIILSAESFEEFISTLRYIDVIHEHNLNEVKSLTTLEDELVQTRALLSTQRETAIKKQDEARIALEEAREARAKLQAHALAIAISESDAREEAIAIAREALESADVAASSLPATFTTSSGNTAQIEVPTQSSVSADPLTSNLTSEETSDWATRIDAYLAGSPLEGYGSVFAEAAATYGVDPRLSPAIATIESGKGTYCFEDHNAWGWGSSGWSDWESAIYEQVEGLATGYDGTLTLEGAERYCPPNYEEWYSSVASEMDGI